MATRDGRRKPRSSKLPTRIPTLGYYCIVTDTKETEKNYLDGLKESLPDSLRDKLVIKVFSAQKTSMLVEEAQRQHNLHSQYAEPWIVFDRDRVTNFDDIISMAHEKNIKVGWSNPCIEIWLHAYYGSMPNHSDSVACWKGFATVYKTKTKQEYDKADKSIYRKLCETGSENTAIRIAAQRLQQKERDGFSKPSLMTGTTTVHLLINSIREKASFDE